MNKYHPSKQWFFEVYTCFGRVVKRFPIGLDETHHTAQEQARIFIKDNDAAYSNRLWVRLIK